MNNNIFFKSSLIILSLLCCFSCYDDKGNYDYNPINELTISGFEDKYQILIGEAITIKPVVEATLPGNEEDYSYEWVWLNASYKNTTYAAYVWSTLKEWDDFDIGLPAKTYTFCYRVTEKKTGVAWTSKTFSVQIINDISLGFFILSEVDNKGRLDFVNFSQNKFDLRLNILEKVGTELPSLEKPLGIHCCGDNNSPYFGASTISGEVAYMCAILTENGTFRLRPGTFEYEDRFDIKNHFFLAELLPADFYAKDFFCSYLGTSDILLLDNNNNLYSYYSTLRVHWTTNTYTNITPDGRLIKISPKIAISYSGGAIMYDTENLSFVKQTAQAANTSNYYASSNEKEWEQDGETLLFKYNNTGKELVYLYSRRVISGLGGDPVYTILKDPVTNELFFGSFTAAGVQKSYFKMKNAPELSEAKDFTMTYNGRNYNYANEFVYYRTDTKIYAYNTNEKRATLVYPIGGEETGHRISYFGFIKPGDATTLPWNDHMMVATYDPSKSDDSCGKLQVLKVTPVYGNLTVAEYDGKKMEWEGFGKIIDVDWKEK